MTRTFNATDLAGFARIVGSFPWTRAISEVHLHHTWRPRQIDYQGHATIVAMWRYHTETNGWSDIGQHVTIAPDGAIWLCRNFNWAPASAVGFNGNGRSGPFMIEMIGDFDRGRETITKAQNAATLGVIKAVQTRFGLRPSNLRFHSEMSDKSCPGDSFDKADLIRQIEEFELPAPATRSRGAAVSSPFPDQSSRTYELVRALQTSAVAEDDMSRAEHGLGLAGLDRATRGGNRAGEAITDAMINELSDHVVNLTAGRFSESGKIGSSEGDVDRIFDEVLPAEIARRAEGGKKARLLFYAHGGLVSETNALAAAFGQLGFWRDNHVYPVFFIWETGFAETVRQILSDAWQRLTGSRGPVSWVTNNLIEEVVRTLHGGRVWDAMKASAERASADQGGARYVAHKAAKLFSDHKDALEIHTVGHSAGAIFNAYLMRELVENGARVATAQYLAPAIRNDLFHEEVAPRLGRGIGPLTIYTMRKTLEKADTVTFAYRQSLLYLVHEALEDRRQTPILGLEASLRADPEAKRLFGLSGSPSAKGEIVWSTSDDTASGRGSRSTTHGGFDDDSPTMTSVARRILNRMAGEPVIEFPATSRGTLGADIWEGQVDWPAGLEDIIAAAAPVGAPADDADETRPVPATSGKAAVTGRRTALCIGIDRYPRMPLNGCVADARLWALTLGSLGFDTHMLTDREATAETIRDRIGDLIAGAKAGDGLVIQYAGHGTQFTDTDGDEGGPGTPDPHDECLCGVDCEDSGSDGLVIDDELKLIFDGLPEEANLTVFLDSCHSGTATRAAVRMAAAAARARGGEDARARYLRPSATMQSAYLAQRARLSRSDTRKSALAQRDILFSACTSKQLAYESNGQGDFTRRATALLKQAKELSNRDFLERVLRAFGSGARQTPELHCDVAMRDRRLLGF